MREIAYCGPAPTPAGIWTAWNFDPALIAALGAAALFGWLRLAEGRGAFLAGIGVLALAFVSPLCAMTSALFSARTVHHLLAIAVAAPLIATGLRSLRPPGTATGTGTGIGDGIGDGVLAPALIAATVTLWAWHVPAFYTAALTSTALYWLMQLTLVVTAILFWRALLSAPPVSALIALAATIGQMGLLGALLTFAPEPLYPHHFVAPVAWGLTPIGDQQLAGLLMWVPGNLPYAVLALVIARRFWRLQEAAA